MTWFGFISSAAVPSTYYIDTFRLTAVPNRVTLPSVSLSAPNGNSVITNRNALLQVDVINYPDICGVSLKHKESKIMFSEGSASIMYVYICLCDLLVPEDTSSQSQHLLDQELTNLLPMS